MSVGGDEGKGREERRGEEEEKTEEGTRRRRKLNVQYPTRMQRNNNHRYRVIVSESEDARNEYPRHLFTICLPVVAILLRTSLHIACYPMTQNAEEEKRIEERKRRPHPAYERPAHGHGEISGVVNLTRNTPPAVSKKWGAVFRSDEGGISEITGWKLREGPAMQECASLMLTKMTLLSLSLHR